MGKHTEISLFNELDEINILIGDFLRDVEDLFKIIILNNKQTHLEIGVTDLDERVKFYKIYFNKYEKELCPIKFYRQL